LILVEALAGDSVKPLFALTSSAKEPKSDSTLTRNRCVVVRALVVRRVETEATRVVVVRARARAVVVRIRRVVRRRWLAVVVRVRGRSIVLVAVVRRALVVVVRRTVFVRRVVVLVDR
jgi:hypothetical protein